MALSCALVGLDGLKLLENVGMIGGLLAAALLKQTYCGFAGSKAVHFKGKAIFVEIASDEIIDFRRKFMRNDGRKFLFDEVIDEVHALFHPIFVTASLYLHHDIEEFV